MNMFTEVPYSTETAARETLEQVMADALSKSGSNRSAVRAVCLAVSGVNHPTDQQRILSWLRFDLRNHLSIFLLMLEIDSLCYFSLHQIYFTFCKAPFFFLPFLSWSLVPRAHHSRTRIRSVIYFLNHSWNSLTFFSLLQQMSKSKFIFHNLVISKLFRNFLNLMNNSILK